MTITTPLIDASLRSNVSMASELSASPLTSSGSQLMASCPTAVIGVSPFNSYFSDSRMRRLVAWAQTQCEDVYLYLPDGPSVHTLLALGYGPSKARRKARKQATWLRNKMKRAMLDNGYLQEEAETRILDSEKLDRNAKYSQSLQAMRTQFDVNHEFRKACLDASTWVLRNKLNRTPSLEARQCGAEYLLAELPIFTVAAEVLECRATAFIYHQCPTFISHLYAGLFGPLVAENQAFVVVSDATTQKAARPLQ